MFPETKKDNFSSTLCEESGGEKIENRDFKRSIRKGGIHKKYSLDKTRGENKGGIVTKQGRIEKKKGLLYIVVGKKGFEVIIPERRG